MTKKWNMKNAEYEREKHAIEEVVIDVMDAILPDFDSGNINKEHRKVIDQAVRDFFAYKRNSFLKRIKDDQERQD